MSKPLKRKITSTLTSKSKAISTSKSRPSVFERLGTKASTILSKEFCHHWAQNGICPYGKGCKYSATHTLTSPSKQRAAKSQEEKRRNGKDAVKRLPGEEEEEWDWNPEELEDADPDDLEKRRAELQRELELQMKMEKTRKKEKRLKKDSSPSSDSSSSSSDSTSSSEDSSSSSSSTEARKKKVKKTKSKRDSSSSSDEPKTKKIKKLSMKSEKDKKSGNKTAKSSLKSPTPVRIQKQSQTPPPKMKSFVPSKAATSEVKSPRPSSRLSGKEKYRTPSPKCKDKDKEREKEKEKPKEKERIKDKDIKKKERSPKRENKNDQRNSKEIKRKDTPDSVHSRDKKISPSGTKGNNSGSSNTTMKRDHRSPSKDLYRSKKEDRDRFKPKDRNDSKNRKDRRDSRDREKERERERERRLAREKEREEALARCQERQRERERLKKLKEEEERRARERNRRDDRVYEKPSNDRSERPPLHLKDRLPQSSRKGHSLEHDRNERRDRDIRRDRSPSDNRILRKSSLDRHDRLDRDLDRDRMYDRSDRSYDRNRDIDRERETDYGRLHEVDRRLDEKDYDSPYDRARIEDRRYMDMENRYDTPRDDHLPMDTREYMDDRRSRRDVWNMRDDRDMDRDRNLDHLRYGRDERHSPAMKGREWEGEYADMEWGRRQEWDTRDVWDVDMKHATEEEWRLYNANRMDNWPAEDRRRWPVSDWRENRDHSRPRSVASHNRDENSVMDSRRKDHNIRHDSHRNETITRLERNERNQSLPRSETSHDQIKKEPPVDTQPPDEIHPSKGDRENKEPEKREIIVKEEIRETNHNETSEKIEENDPKKVGPPSPTNIKREIETPENTVEPKKPCIEPILEDDLSEISDDADEILNRDEEVIEELEEEVTQENAETSSLKEQPSVASQKSQSPSRSPVVNRLSKEGSIDEENIELDFEEISEDELEEESRVKGIGDALGVDWASLVAESRPRIKPVSSAKKRWESHNVLFHLGISVDLAGEEYVKEIYKEHKEFELKEKNQVKEEEVKKEIKEEIIENNIKKEIEIEKCEENQNFDENVLIPDPLAEMQVACLEKLYLKRTLLTSVGPYRRALSARRDLMIRRHLCNLPITDYFVEAPKRHDPELFELALKLIRKESEKETV